ncbi:MAG: hypothetical protein GQ542_17435 [Desulforhopalus sp.]|nr:hypothetical protein [Desulforhopalus sp.]
MEHINDTQIFDMLGGHVQADEQESLQAHMAQCSNCRQRLDELRQTWDDLGTWEIDTSEIDLLENLTSAIHHRNWHVNFLSIQGLTRIAASILLATFIGYAAGKFSTQKSTEEWGLATAQSSFLQVLSPGSSTGWGELELQGDTLESY